MFGKIRKWWRERREEKERKEELQRITDGLLRGKAWTLSSRVLDEKMCSRAWYRLDNSVLVQDASDRLVDQMLREGHRVFFMMGGRIRIQPQLTEQEIEIYLQQNPSVRKKIKNRGKAG